jgi:prepilin-type N-terminal cleavage/methylation domain-containing protein
MTMNLTAVATGRYPRHLSARSGFTLIELLVVISALSVVVGMLVPAIQKVQATAAQLKEGRNAELVALGDKLEKAARTQANNLKQIGLGTHGFESSYGRSRGTPEAERQASAEEAKKVTQLLESLCACGKEAEALRREVDAASKRELGAKELELLREARTELDRIERETELAIRSASQRLGPELMLSCASGQHIP